MLWLNNIKKNRGFFEESRIIEAIICTKSKSMTNIEKFKHKNEFACFE